MSTKFFTNEDENTLINKIEGIFKHRNIHFFDALVGYFRASGYFRIRKFVEKTSEIRILDGINIDRMIYHAHQQGILFDGDIERAQEDFFLEIKKNIQHAEYDKEVEAGMLQLIEDIEAINYCRNVCYSAAADYSDSLSERPEGLTNASNKYALVLNIMIPILYRNKIIDITETEFNNAAAAGLKKIENAKLRDVQK